MNAPLPHHELAIISAEKLRDYCLNPKHPRGADKAKVFASALGLAQKDHAVLAAAIRDGLPTAPCYERAPTRYGRSFTVDGQVQVALGSATVRTGWVIDIDAETPRLVSAYVKL